MSQYTRTRGVGTLPLRERVELEATSVPCPVSTPRAHLTMGHWSYLYTCCLIISTTQQYSASYCFWSHALVTWFWSDLAQNLTGDSFSRGNLISSAGLTLKHGSRSLMMAPLDKIHDFLLVFYSNFGRISYRLWATVDFVPKWPCRATVTSRWQWRSIRINSKMKSVWNWAKICFLFLCKFVTLFVSSITGKRLKLS